MYFDGDQIVLEERILERSKTSGRVDDKLDIFRKRYQGFVEENADVLDYFQQRGKLHKVKHSFRTG